MDYTEFGKRILRLRKEFKLTQQQLADRLFVIDKTISRWECGHGFPEITTIKKICEIFDIPFDLLMDEKNGLSDPNISLAELKSKYVKKEGKKKNKIFIALGLGGAAIAIGVAIIVPMIVGGNTIEQHSWEIAETSNANYVFFTSFGKEETMSLELNGDLKSGNFVCVESWIENEGNQILDCKVSGTYKFETIDDVQKIKFVATSCVDPYSTKKLYTNMSIGVEYYLGDVVTSIKKDEEQTINESPIGISFTSKEAKTSLSAFGRWTKYKAYFSRVEGEIFFQRVNKKLTIAQLAHSPNMMLEDMNASVPQHLAVFTNPNKTVYMEGETFNKEGMNIALIYNNGSTYDITEQVTVIDEGVPLTIRDYKKMLTYKIDDLTLATYIFIRVYSQD